MREICARRLRFLLRVFLANKVYPDWEHAKYHPGVGYVVHVLRWVAAGQIISGKRPTVCRNVLDRSHHCPLDTRASVSSQVVLTY
jgi:hypothetical protein